MDLKDIRAKKTEAENNISKMLLKFEKDTECYINMVKVGRLKEWDYFNENDNGFAVNIEISL